MKFFKKKKKKENKTFQSGKRWSAAEEKILLEALSNDVHIDDIAQTLGRKPSAVISKTQSIQKKRRSGAWSDIETRLLIAYWNQDKSIEYISRALDRKHNSVKGRLVTLDGYPSKISQTISDDLIKTIEQVISSFQEIDKLDKKPDGYKNYHSSLALLSKRSDKELFELAKTSEQFIETIEEEKELIKEVSRLDKEIDKAETELLNEIALSILKDPSKAYARTGKIDEKLKDLVKKGYEIEHIAEILGLTTELVNEKMQKENLFENYDLLMIKKAEDRYHGSMLKKGNMMKSEHEQRLLNARKEEQAIRDLCYRTVKNPEDTKNELKQTFERNTKFPDIKKDPNLTHSVLKNVCAFANSAGGTLVIGVVDESREMVGIEFDNFKDEETYIKNIYQKIRNNFGVKFSSFFDVHTTSQTSKRNGEVILCMINVDNSPEPVIFVHEEYSKKNQLSKDREYYYIREGADTIELRGQARIEHILSDNFSN